MVLIKKRIITGLMICTSLALATNYYQQDFFPIGFTGFEHTAYWGGDGSPYPDDYDYGTWAWEDTLLRRSDCNFIGCADADKDIYMYKCAIDKNITLNYNPFKPQTL